MCVVCVYQVLGDLVFLSTNVFLWLVCYAQWFQNTMNEMLVGECALARGASTHGRFVCMHIIWQFILPVATKRLAPLVKQSLWSFVEFKEKL